MNKTTSIITKPSQCVLGFGIPTSRAAFRQSLSNKNKDYASKIGPSWSYYNTKIANPINALAASLAKTGLTIIHDLTFKKFQTLFSEYDVIILFSHWKDDKIEFYEGLIPIEPIVDIIPYEFYGIIDFSVCHPKAISLRIREKKLNCTTRYSKSKLEKPIYWLYFYLQLFKELEKNNWYYFDAFRNSILQSLNEANE